MPVGVTVLFIDDDEMICTVSSLALERAGFAVHTACNGEEACALLREHGEAVSIVVLDMILPGMDGKDTMRALRQIRPGLRIILTSGYGELETLGRFGALEHSGFLQKPFTPDALITMVNRCMT